MDIFWSFVKAFCVGGLICVVGQLLISLTRLTPARILVLFVTLGVVLGGLGLYEPLVERLRGLLGNLDRIEIPPSDVLEIPVLYGGEMGPDLEFVAQHSGKTPEEVVKIHTSTEYLIYMLGFTPGFTYLGGMNEEIATPRLKTPRVKIPAGSVGIAGAQTGVYPIDSPGGWQLIGRTPVRMYDPDRATPILPQAGQYIRFYAIDQAEYDRIAAEEAAGTYVCGRHPRKEGGK